MCGRFESKPSIQALVDEFKKENKSLNIQMHRDIAGKEREAELSELKSFNISPTSKILSISYTEKNYNLFQSNWGIKFSAESPLIFNSRIETIKEKKYWNNLFNKNRLLVPMSAFYEWKKEGTKKIPYRIFLPGVESFYVPALYHIDKDKSIFASLITTAPNDFIKPIHHRMPVILEIKDAIDYLINDPEVNLSKCVPYAGKMELEQITL